ncbi:MAG: hypothetical protein V8S08_06600 [Lachnoclostridium sp.]
MMVTICDTAVALTAGFVIIPSVVGAGSEMAAGPSLDIPCDDRDLL